MDTDFSSHLSLQQPIAPENSGHSPQKHAIEHRFKIGDRILYLPPHVKKDLYHPMVAAGEVVAINVGNVYVVFDDDWEKKPQSCAHECIRYESERNANQKARETSLD